MSGVVDLTEFRQKFPGSPIPRRPAKPADSPAQGTAYVVRVDIWRWGMCTCNTWSGRRRLLKASAIQDAQKHALTNGCALASPLEAPRGMTWLATC